MPVSEKDLRGLREIIEVQRKVLKDQDLLLAWGKDDKAQLGRMRKLLVEAVDYIKGEPNKLTAERLTKRIEAELHDLPRPKEDADMPKVKPTDQD